MTAKKATLTKEQTAGVEKVGLEEIHDATSAEAADVEQGDAEFQTIGAEEVGKIDALLGDSLPPPPPDVPAYSGIEQRLGELEKQIHKKAPEELGEWIADVESKQGQRLAELESQLSNLVLEHHDRLLQLEMKVTALSGEDEGGPGPG